MYTEGTVMPPKRQRMHLLYSIIYISLGAVPAQTNHWCAIQRPLGFVGQQTPHVSESHEASPHLTNTTNLVRCCGQGSLWGRVPALLDSATGPPSYGAQLDHKTQLYPAWPQPTLNTDLTEACLEGLLTRYSGGGWFW